MVFLLNLLALSSDTCKFYVIKGDPIHEVTTSTFVIFELLTTALIGTMGGIQ